MKRMLVAALAVLLVLTAFGCGGKKGEYSGLVVSSGGNPEFFELQTSNKNYGFVINDETELVWKDKSAIEEFPQMDEWSVFGCNMRVTVVAGEKTESADEYVDECVEGWYIAKKVTVTKVESDYFAVDAKPVIYLYPEEKTEVSVKLDYNGRLTCTYPKSSGQWNVTAYPDGTIIDETGREYSYLYWEGESPADYDFSKGFCVAGDETAQFLEGALEKLGLTRKEANEFIVYWLPQMETNEYNLISFQSNAYTDKARLDVNPEPDTVIRVFMAWKPVESKVSIPAQELTAPERKGFTVVEWGGSKIN